MITELTEEQKAKFPDYVRKWVNIGISTEPIDMIEAVKHIKGAYVSAELPEPKHFIGPINGPYEAALAEQIVIKFARDGTDFEDSADLNRMVLEELDKVIQGPKFLEGMSISNQIYGYQEYWLSYYDYFQNECGLDLWLINPLIELSKVCGWWTPMNDVAIIQHRPLEIHRDSQNRLHKVGGPAVKFRGGLSDVYALNGIRVEQRIAEGKFTVKDILEQTNAEVRRVMIDYYGMDKFLMESEAVLVNKDDFGELYRKDLAGDEPLMMVKVVNSTPEPDGSFKDYFIRVDPKAYGGLKTAHAAVASTFREPSTGEMVFNNPNEYQCDVET